MTNVTPTAPATVTLRSGAVVLAKPYHGDLYAVTYANRTQAEKKVADLTAAGAKCAVWRGTGRPFYVRFDLN